MAIGSSCLTGEDTEGKYCPLEVRLHFAIEQVVMVLHGDKAGPCYGDQLGKGLGELPRTAEKHRTQLTPQSLSNAQYVARR